MYTVQGRAVSARLRETDGAITILDLKNGAEFTSAPSPDNPAVTGVRADEGGIRYDLAFRGGACAVHARLFIDADDAVRLELAGAFDFDGEIAYPGRWIPAAGDVTLLPLQEGMAFPVDDKDADFPPERPFYRGWTTSLQMWALLRGDKYLVSAVEDSIDAVARESRDEAGRIVTQLSWVPEKGKWGYTRKMRFFVGVGGVTGAAKAYRRMMIEKGMLVTLREKAHVSPNLKKIMGAANVWMWDIDPKDVAQDMKAHGMDKVLWSNIASKEEVDWLKDDIGWLVGRYDNFRDVATPAILDRISRTTNLTMATRNPLTDLANEAGEINRTYFIHNAAYPRDLRVDENGEYGKCWVIYPDDESSTMLAMCGARYIKYAARDIPRDIEQRGYEARFVDTLPTTPYEECYSPLHPTTRTTDAKWRLAATQYMCDMGLVTGVEDMSDIAAPHAHYSEGIMSPAWYRQPDAGYDMQKVMTGKDVPDVILKFQLNPAYRVPLFQLVFHDSVVSYWYWGDSDTNFPELMPRRDTFNALYGTLPLYGATKANWESLRDKVYASYPRATRVHKLAGWDEMTGFEYLTPDKAVQRTTFANGVTVTANLSAAPYETAEGMLIQPDDFLVE